METSGKTCLGIDIGGTSAKYAIIDAAGNILRRGSFETGAGLEKEVFLHKLTEVIEEAVGGNIAGVGLCTLGVVNRKTGQIMGAAQNMPFLDGLNLKEYLKTRFPGLPVCISNDVKAVARGERWLGAAKDCRNFFCVTLGTGLGGALVIDSHVVEGSHFHAGEIGYLDYKNDSDYVEKKVSTKVVMERAAKELGRKELDGFQFFDLVRGGEATCLRILDEWVEDIARFIANLNITLDLDMILIGGGVSNESDILIPRIASRVEQMLPPEFRGQTKIAAAQFTNDAGMLGAVSEYMQ